MNTAQQERFLSRSEAQAFAGGVSPRTLTRWEVLGLPTYAAPTGRGKRLYRASDINAFLLRRCEKADLDRTIEEVMNSFMKLSRPEMQTRSAAQQRHGYTNEEGECQQRSPR